MVLQMAHFENGARLKTRVGLHRSRKPVYKKLTP
jgi:hypothetical protein